MDIEQIRQLSSNRKYESQAFVQCLDAFKVLVEAIPLEVRPIIDYDKIFLCTKDEYIAITTSYGIEHAGLSKAEAISYAQETAKTQAGCILRDTGDILISLDETQTKAFKSNLELFIHFLRILSHEAGHTLIQTQSANLELAAQVMLITPDVLRKVIKNNYNGDPDKCRFALYGNMVDLSLQDNGKNVEIGLARDKRITEIAPDVFMHYSCFLAWCLKNNIDSSISESIVDYSSSKEFQISVTPDELTSVPIIRFAAKFGGFERLIKLLIDSQNIYIDSSEVVLSDDEILGLKAIFEASQLQEIINESILQILEGQMSKAKDYFDIAFKALKYAIKKGNEERLIKSTYGMRESNRDVTVEGEEHLMDRENIVLLISREVFDSPDGVDIKRLGEKAKDILLEVANIKRGLKVRL